MVLLLIHKHEYHLTFLMLHIVRIKDQGKQLDLDLKLGLKIEGSLLVGLSKFY